MILGVSFNTVEQNAAFAKKYGFLFPLLCDVDRKIGLAYGAAENADQKSAKRISYLIDPLGRVAHVFQKVAVKEHPQEVLDLL